MTGRDTDSVLASLSDGLEPVRRVLPLRGQVAIVLGVASAWLLACLWLSGGLWRMNAVGRSVGFAAVLAGLALLGGGAVLGAAARSVPGRERAARAGIGSAIAGALLALGGAGGSVLLAGWSEVPLRSSLTCLAESWALGLVPALASGLLAARAWRRGLPAAAVWAVAGGAALGGIAIHLTCREGTALHVLLGHASAPVWAGLVLGLPAARLLAARIAR